MTPQERIELTARETQKTGRLGLVVLRIGERLTDSIALDRFEADTPDRKRIRELKR